MKSAHKKAFCVFFSSIWTSSTKSSWEIIELRTIAKKGWVFVHIKLFNTSTCESSFCSRYHFTFYGNKCRWQIFFTIFSSTNHWYTYAVQSSRVIYFIRLWVDIDNVCIQLMSSKINLFNWSISEYCVGSMYLCLYSCIVLFFSWFHLSVELIILKILH